jgi:hypothetical protein
MTGTLQRTEQVITVAELREMLDDEDEKSFADLSSKGVAQVRGGAWRREQDGRWRFWQDPSWSDDD